MNDETTTQSGSRWEPGPEAAEAPEAPANDERRAQLRGRAILVGAATALTLGGGLTGFVIGHSTAGGDDGSRPATSFQRNGSNGGPGGQLGEGQQGPPSFRDGDGDGFGPPQGFDDGSSSNGSGATGSST